MNVFEDLIVELKEENLLELTVIDADKKGKPNTKKPEGGEGSGQLSVFDAPDETLYEEAESDLIELESFDVSAEAENVKVEIADTPTEAEVPRESSAKQKRARHGKDFFNKRAVDEVASHQMVEHIMTGVEREYLKIVPKAFDDMKAKKALHFFVNIADNSNSEQHKKAEFSLMQETEAWGLALLERDCNISVSLIRQYCENSKPALSSQAMLALARFYRNAPYSESVRSKFDFVITRLFSRPMEHDRRLCLFGRDEMVGHIQKLYGEWSSIPLYTADSDDSNVLLTGMSFDDLATEAEQSPSFDQLIEGDFFNRLRLFKESISELFYEPSVTASAIESNVRVGNAFVNLIVKERKKTDAESIQSKYGDFNGPSVSDAAGRTLDLAEVLSGLTDEAIKAEEAAEEEPFDPIVTVDSEKAAPKISIGTARPSIAAWLIDSVRTINVWLLVVGLVLVFISAGLYVWSEYFIVEDKISSAGVTNVDLGSNPVFAEHLKTGRISRERFYGFLLPSWDVLPREKREEYLQKLLQAGSEKGYKKVSLISKDGKSAGYASAERLEVTMP